MRHRCLRSPLTLAKLVCAAFIITFYVVFSQLNPPAITKGQPLPKRPTIQFENWQNSTSKAQDERRQRIKDAMRHTFRGYRNKAWGSESIKPVSGASDNESPRWGAFIVESSTTLAIMNEWEQLTAHVDYIVRQFDIANTYDDVDFYDATTRYLGGLVSLIELTDAGIIPGNVISVSRRERIVQLAETLATKLNHAFKSPSGLSWPKINFITGNPSSKDGADDSTISLARAGTNFLELCALSKIAKNSDYCANATMGWADMVVNRYVEDLPGLVDSPLSVESSVPMSTERSWDSGHSSYYEYLLKAHLLLPDTKDGSLYRKRWLEAAESVANNLTSRNKPSFNQPTSHLYLGEYIDQWYLNEMSQVGCSAPATLLLGGSHLQKPELIALGKALLEGCRHLHTSTPTGLAPDIVSWEPSPGYQVATFEAISDRQRAELDRHGFWVVNQEYRLRPELAESLFYAFRITGDPRYRDWAWDLFEAIEKHCRTRYGYAGIEDVMAQDDETTWLDRSESHWTSRTLKYLYLIFDDAYSFSLDDWIFTAGGHLVRRGH